MFEKTNTDQLCEQYLEDTHALMKRILVEERSPLELAAQKLGDQIAADKLVHIYGPGGHSNLASQEIFFRAGGLMHVSAILDEGTLLSGGALRSMAIERNAEVFLSSVFPLMSMPIKPPKPIQQDIRLLKIFTK